MTVLVLTAVIILRKMKIHLFRFRLLFAGLLSGLFYVLLPALIVLRPKKVNPLLGKVVI